MTVRWLVDKSALWRANRPEVVGRGQHRTVGVPGLLIAATALVEGLTVLHYDAEFDIFAEITHQPMEWVGPRGRI